METEKTLSDIEKLSKIADILGYDLTEKAGLLPEKLHAVKVF